MDQYAGIDVSLECSSVCVVDASGKIVREAKVASEREALIGWFRSSGIALERIGLEAGPLSQWLFAAMWTSPARRFFAIRRLALRNCARSVPPSRRNSRS